MREYTDCYIAFIDLLGFKNIVENTKCDEIASLFDEMFTDYLITYGDDKTPWVSPEIVKMKVMSDTICFYVDASKTDAFAKIIAACAYFQVRLMRLSKPILSRGAIVRDKIYNNSDITFGPGVNRAYLLEEKLAVNPRIIIDDSLRDMSVHKLTAQGKEYVNTYTYKDYDYLCVDSLFLLYGLSGKTGSWNGFVEYINNGLNDEKAERIHNKFKYVHSKIPDVISKLQEMKI